ncbi:hypothetical protein PVAG01_10434 [Phlyctema vagabunda]|uniref:CHRD domain-containing protein n=1 Tax=Phlyctema vagabunda TaxID=108571 RepID=A0ABR4P604_9HELO
MKYSTTLLGLASVASAQQFTSIFNVTATPDQVVNASSISTPGQPGAKGQFNYALNSQTNTICYDITLYGVTGDYRSPALTATHIHEAAVGRNGPPRIAFPNPVGDDTVRRSAGCLTGPFLTGIKAADNVTDTGAGFTVAQIEANPGGFFTDSHTVLFPAGVVRGQLSAQQPPVSSPAGNTTTIPSGADITTATLTKTVVSTIKACPTEVIDCPYLTKPVTTTTFQVYTTVCPVSNLPGYTTPAGHPTTIVTTGTAHGTNYLPTKTAPPTQFTGAANSKQVGRVMVAAGLLCAML